MADRPEFDVAENCTVDEECATGSGISRRMLVKAGAATAWTVPLIQVIAAAPAHAATSGLAQLTVTCTGSWNPKGKLDTSVTLTNTGSLEADGVQVTYTAPNKWTSLTVTGSTWPNPSVNGLSAVFTEPSPGTIAPGSSVTLRATLVPGNSAQSNKAVTIPVTVTWSGPNSPASSSIVV